MKKKLSILFIAIALVLALAGAFAIFASTNIPPVNLSIASKNLSFSDSVYIIFYVDAEGVEADDVNLLVWNSSKESYTIKDSPQKLSLVRVETINGKDYLRFEYRKLAAKNMTDTIYARAYVSSGSQEYYSELTNYSVLQYAYNKLGKTGTATSNAELKALLTDMLEYGAAAQLEFDYKADRLATSEFKQIKIEGGTLPDKCTKGLFLENDTLTLTANEPSDGKVFKGWKKDAGAIFSTESAIEITVGSSNATYTAVFE